MSDEPHVVKQYDDDAFYRDAYSAPNVSEPEKAREEPTAGNESPNNQGRSVNRPD